MRFFHFPDKVDLKGETSVKNEPDEDEADDAAEEGDYSHIFTFLLCNRSHFNTIVARVF